MKEFILTILIILFGIKSIYAQSTIDTSSIISNSIKYEILGINLYPKKLNFNSTHYQHKAYFCRLEDKLYNKSGKNIRFRLGNLEYVDILESK